jgi:ribonuclease VapC
VGAVAKLAEHSQVAALAAIKQAVDGSLQVEPFTEEDAAEADDLRPRSRDQGLSFGDRACLALAARFEVPAVTADRSWKDLPEVGVAVRLIR